MIKKIRALKPDMAILLTNSFRSVLPVWLGRAKYIYGYRRDLRGLFFSGGPRPLRSGGKIVPLPMQEYYLEICRWLNLKTAGSNKTEAFYRR